MRTVIKIGSSSLIDSDGMVRFPVLGQIMAACRSMIDDGEEVIVVSSGAIATGMAVQSRTSRPAALPELQALSALGQGTLFGFWQEQAQAAQTTIAQVLLTMHDVSHRATWLNAQGTLETLMRWKTVAIVNENDTTATDEITFGDNDTLAAQIAVMLQADRLILLTDIDGLYTAPPGTGGSTLIEEVTDSHLLDAVAVGGSESTVGKGGMASKVIAAEMAVTSGTDVWIAGAQNGDAIPAIRAGANPGTHFPARPDRHSAFKLWLRHAKRTRGKVTIDDGARAALIDRKASLLCVGITSCEGTFLAGDAVEILASDGTAIARGLASMAAGEVSATIAGDPSGVEFINRDQLVIL